MQVARNADNKKVKVARNKCMCARTGESAGFGPVISAFVEIRRTDGDGRLSPCRLRPSETDLCDTRICATQRAGDDQNLGTAAKHQGEQSSIYICCSNNCTVGEIALHKAKGEVQYCAMSDQEFSGRQRQDGADGADEADDTDKMIPTTAAATTSNFIIETEQLQPPEQCTDYHIPYETAQQVKGDEGKDVAGPSQTTDQGRLEQDAEDVSVASEAESRGGQDEEESVCSISSSQAARNEELLAELDFNVAVAKTPGSYVADAATASALVSLPTAMYTFGFVTGLFVLLMSGFSTHPHAPSRMPLDAHQIACQQLCQRGQCNVTAKRSPRDWLFEADNGLQALSATTQLEDGDDLSQTIVSCQVSLGDLWTAVDGFHLHIQLMATKMTQVESASANNRLRRNNEQLDRSLALIDMVRNAPLLQLHRSLNASRTCTRELVHRILGTSDAHAHFAISADGALRRFSDLCKSAVEHFEAALPALYRHTNATAHFVGDHSRELDLVRDGVGALLALW